MANSCTLKSMPEWRNLMHGNIHKFAQNGRNHRNVVAMAVMWPQWPHWSIVVIRIIIIIMIIIIIAMVMVMVDVWWWRDEGADADGCGYNDLHFKTPPPLPRRPRPEGAAGGCPLPLLAPGPKTIFEVPPPQFIWQTMAPSQIVYLSPVWSWAWHREHLKHCKWYALGPGAGPPCCCWPTLIT